MSSVYKRGCDRDRRRAPWYLSYIDEVGVRRQKKGFTDKGATEKLAHKLEEEARMAREGIKEKGLPAKEATIDYQLAAYCKFLLQRDVSASRVQAVKAKIEKIAGGCNFTSIDEISTQPIEEYLANRRDAGLSKQTSNHYRQAIHQFCRWLCRKAKLKSNPISEIPKLNAQTDRRHDRRALADDEFQRLIAAAEVGPPVESIVGIDRVIMYILAAWTGYRRGEIGSLTLSSFSLETEHATVTVEARYSKRRRKDLQVLHPEVVDRFRKWLEVRKPTHEKFLFPITAEACGFERKTAKMMRKDLQAARKVWIEEADTEV
ncbi:MAG: tyrosine-type recombinase/integrase, partial [Pirellulaceae bacterium]|nr:tyrosine-type recombinase/integrase [Pirellulaceae bacterium]